jgi:hypothetical protein
MEGKVKMGKETPIEGAVEWCFKFNNEEAVVFGRAEKNDPLKIEIPATEEGSIAFSANGNSFEIFPRQLVEAEVQAIEDAHEDAAQ